MFETDCCPVVVECPDRVWLEKTRGREWRWSREEGREERCSRGVDASHPTDFDDLEDVVVFCDDCPRLVVCWMAGSGLRGQGGGKKKKRWRRPTHTGPWLTSGSVLCARDCQVGDDDAQAGGGGRRRTARTPKHNSRPESVCLAEAAGLRTRGRQGRLLR